MCLRCMADSPTLLTSNNLPGSEARPEGSPRSREILQTRGLCPCGVWQTHRIRLPAIASLDPKCGLRREVVDSSDGKGREICAKRLCWLTDTPATSATLVGCRVNNKTFESGENFSLDCRTQCSCQVSQDLMCTSMQSVILWLIYISLSIFISVYLSLCLYLYIYLFVCLSSYA